MVSQNSDITEQEREEWATDFNDVTMTALKPKKQPQNAATIAPSASPHMLQR
jgi:hypothetical protein